MLSCNDTPVVVLWATQGLQQQGELDLLQRQHTAVQQTLAEKLVALESAQGICSNHQSNCNMQQWTTTSYAGKVHLLWCAVATAMGVIAIIWDHASVGQQHRWVVAY